MNAEQSPQAGDHLLQAVVANRHILPASLQQILLRDDLASTGHEQEQHVKLAVGERDRLSGTAQTSPVRVELEGLEREVRADRHWQSPDVKSVTNRVRKRTRIEQSGIRTFSSVYDR